MANISDVYSIEFIASSEPLAERLEVYLKAIEAKDPYYNATQGVERDGRVVKGHEATGRWVYSNNLEGTFERPEEWYDNDLPKAEWEAVLKLLKAGETIDVSYSEDEPGCEVFQDAFGEIGVNDETGKVYVSLNFEEHDRPDCQMVANPDGTWYCEDHDHDQAEESKYCEVAE